MRNGMIANGTAASEAEHCKGRTVLRQSLHSSVLSESTLGAACGTATGDCTVAYSLLAFVRQAAQRRIVLGHCVITACTRRVLATVAHSATCR